MVMIYICLLLLAKGQEDLIYTEVKKWKDLY